MVVNYGQVPLFLSNKPQNTLTEAGYADEKVGPSGDKVNMLPVPGIEL